MARDSSPDPAPGLWIVGVDGQAHWTRVENGAINSCGIPWRAGADGRFLFYLHYPAPVPACEDCVRYQMTQATARGIEGTTALVVLERSTRPLRKRSRRSRG